MYFVHKGGFPAGSGRDSHAEEGLLEGEERDGGEERGIHQRGFTWTWTITRPLLLPIRPAWCKACAEESQHLWHLSLFGLFGYKWQLFQEHTEAPYPQTVRWKPLDHSNHVVWINPVSVSNGLRPYAGLFLFVSVCQAEADVMVGLLSFLPSFSHCKTVTHTHTHTHTHTFLASVLQLSAHKRTNPQVSILCLHATAHAHGLKSERR